MQIDAIDGTTGRCRSGGETHTVDLVLVPEARPGDHVLVFLGTARRLLSADEAAQIARALAGLAAVFQGGGATDLDAAFADLAGRAPALPPHLEAARAAGLKEA
jgi:hydrogenase expression/formation protein HypC